MSRSDERWKLAEVVERLERAVQKAKGSSGGVDASQLIANLEGLKDRMAVVDHEIELLREEKKQLSEKQLSIVYLTQRETALSQAEREQYGAFLTHEFFTKEDFNSLSDFYTKTWDRLSEEGKTQMSYRVWEGVRRQEYQFSELPDPVKEKEAQRLYEAFKVGSQKNSELNQIPAADRDNFMAAWSDDRRQDAYEALNRPVFAKNVSIRTQAEENPARGQSTAEHAASIRDSGGKSLPPEEAKQIMGSVDLTDVDIKLPDTDGKAIAPTRLSEPKAVANAPKTPGD